jgi:hypothetical protein
MEYIVASTSPESLDEMLGGITATVLAGGHTHFQMVRQHHGDLVINLVRQGSRTSRIGWMTSVR